MSLRNLKPKLCRMCKGEFVPVNSTQIVCHWKCAAEYVDKRRSNTELATQRRQEREIKRQHREQKEAVRPLRWYLNKAQVAFNAYIRKRNEGASCVSCGAPDSDKTHQAGHFRPAGINTALRFNENNCWPQCLQCNMHRSGNVAEYRRRLSVLIGEEAVCELEQNNEVKKWSKEELIEIRKHYQHKLKELRST
jgi:hypothetical protein